MGQLWITWARSRVRYGRPTECGASRFIEELPEAPGVIRRERDGPAATAEDPDRLANEFFQKMREQLGGDE